MSVSDRLPREWPTWVMLLVCYGLWFASLASWGTIGFWFAVPAAISVALHSSLQHEVLHGHPTRSAWLNEALIYPAIGVLIAYRRYKDTHLRHHNDTHLTDPYDDPESFYLAESDYAAQPAWKRSLLQFNQTLVGRWVVGPPLSLVAFWSDEIRRIRDGDTRSRSAWFHHALGLVPVVAVVVAFGIPLWLYGIVAWAGMALIMTRSFIEHRAVESVGERTAVVEAGWFMSLLYLNNNLHAVHHRAPTLAWYALPARWRADRDAVLSDNGNYLLSGGYASVLMRWALRRREPVVHPVLRKSSSHSA